MALGYRYYTKYYSLTYVALRRSTAQSFQLADEVKPDPARTRSDLKNNLKL